MNALSATLSTAATRLLVLVALAALAAPLHARSTGPDAGPSIDDQIAQIFRLVDAGHEMLAELEPRFDDVEARFHAIDAAVAVLSNVLAAQPEFAIEILSELRALRADHRVAEADFENLMMTVQQIQVMIWELEAVSTQTNDRPAQEAVRQLAGSYDAAVSQARSIKRMGSETGRAIEDLARRANQVLGGG